MTLIAWLVALIEVLGGLAWVHLGFPLVGGLFIGSAVGSTLTRIQCTLRASAAQSITRTEAA